MKNCPENTDRNKLKIATNKLQQYDVDRRTRTSRGNVSFKIVFCSYNFVSGIFKNEIFYHNQETTKPLCG
jgi:hypothetical protein